MITFFRAWLLKAISYFQNPFTRHKKSAQINQFINIQDFLEQEGSISFNASEDVSFIINGGEFKGERANDVAGNGEVIFEAVQLTNLESFGFHSSVLVDNRDTELLSKEVVSVGGEGLSDVTASRDEVGFIMGNRLFQSDVKRDPDSVSFTAVLPVRSDGSGGSDEEDSQSEDGFHGF